MTVFVPWAAWHGDVEHELGFPAGWQVEVYPMAGAPGTTLDAVEQALQQPIGTPALADLARDSRQAVIVVEDITRPLPAAALLPAILAELERGGLVEGKVRIVIGLGAHAPMERADLIKKLGQAVVDRFPVYQHQPHENLELLGHSSHGTPVQISRFYTEADLRIGLGSITPHSYAGYGGGAKIVAVGVAGMDTLEGNHSRTLAAGAGAVDRVEDNACRAELEEIARMAGLQFIVNGVVSSRRALVEVVAGDPVQAHRAGVEIARRVYATHLPDPVDVGVFNAYPKDTDLMQSGNALNVVASDPSRVVKAEGTAVLTTACPKGLGIHYLEGTAMRCYIMHERERHFRGRRLILYSPNLSLPEVRQAYDADTVVLNRWEDVMAELEERHGEKATAAVFPSGAVQIPAGE